ncbi:hypothetical protein MKX03_033192 [Papaver bracteatum]|nr:hypothetical protein MKX03_033192 [Papaver bracteatum]
MQQTTTMLKLTPTFHHPPGSMIKKPQIHYTNFPNIHKITNNKPFQITNSPNTHKKDNADADTNSELKEIPKKSALTSEKKLQFHVSSALDPILSAVKWVFSCMTKLISPNRRKFEFVAENDQILLKYNGMEIVGVVQRVARDHDRLMEMTLQSEIGLLENFVISSSYVINQTQLNLEENEKMWRIYTLVECKDGDVEKMTKEIKAILNAHGELKRNSEYNFVHLDSFDPVEKLIVSGFVTVSRLKTPRFEHYMELRRKVVLLEIDEINPRSK